MQTFKNVLLMGLGASAVIAIIILTSYTSPDSNKTTQDVFFGSYILNKTTAPDSLNPPAQKVYAPKMPAAVDFAGDQLPMDNFDALERFDRELISNCFRHSSTFLYLKRANRYFPIIEPILEKNGIPNDFKYLAVAESELSNAISPAGAKGFWQFMPATAKERGMEVSTDVDERYDLEKSTEAACKYLKDAYKSLGSWTLAAASYNMGKMGLEKKISAQGGTDFFDLHLNTETSRYILRIMAIKEIMKDPIKYGFNIEADDLYPPMPKFKVIEESGSISDLADFAKKHNVSYRMVKIYNPWLLGTSLDNKNKKTYQIKVPVEG